MNHWFDSPPPLTARLLARRPPQRCQMPRLTVTERPVAGYDRAQWPHFGRRFAQCEQVFAEARMRLFGGVHHECMTGCWRYLLNIGLAAPCALMDGATAAALGWGMAWTSPVQTLAPSPESSMPALGLATWLACLPLRPPQTPRHRWHLQVLQWLAEDLELSAWAWSRIAAFMQAKGHYVLHGAIGHPKDLAQRHHAEIDGSGRFTSKVE